MLSYQHAYHIGNRADVLKHAMLSMVLAHMVQKPASLTYWDAHAGRGVYPVAGVETQKIREYEQGVAKVGDLTQAPALLAPLAKAYAAYGAEKMAGSPAIAAALLREQDRLELTELHPGEVGFLRQAFKTDKRVKMAHGDGVAHVLEGLAAVKGQGRHIVLLDPSYELADEYEKIGVAIRRILEVAPKAVIQVWYSLMDDGRHEVLEEMTADLRVNGVFGFGAEWAAPAGLACVGTGNILINPPYGLTDDMEQALLYLCGKMGVEPLPHGLVVEHI